MSLSSKGQKIHSQISTDGTKLGDLRKIAKEIKIDQNLAMELWSTGEQMSRLMAILIMDKKLLSPELIDRLCQDIEKHEYDERNQLADWLMANQLTKDKKIINLIDCWEQSPSVIQRRIYWYYQARLRWTGQQPPDNTDQLLSIIEANIAREEPEVQWAMNFLAAWIGVYDRSYRSRCIGLGEKFGLYKDEVVAKGCTPNYLPEFIAIEAEKRGL
jgi:3-methyladenine DNA glycosylase AlkD